MVIRYSQIGGGQPLQGIQSIDKIGEKSSGLGDPDMLGTPDDEPDLPAAELDEAQSSIAKKKVPWQDPPVAYTTPFTQMW